MSVADLDVVPFAGVRWYAEGVYHRDDQSAETVKTKVLNRIEAGDVVYNRMWATKASFGVVGKDAHACLVTNDFPVFRASAEVLAEFVGLMFQWSPFQQAAAASATGTTERRRLNERDFVRLRMPIPPLPEQRRIVDLVGALDDAISTALEALLSASKALAQLRRPPAGEGTQRLGEQVVMRSGPSWKASDEALGPMPGALPVLGITNTPPGSDLDLDKVGFVSGLPASVQTLTDRSLVMIRTNGSRQRIGNVYRATPEVAGFAVSAFQIAMEPINAGDSGFLYWVLGSEDVQGAISSNASGSTGLGNIAVGWLKDLEVPVVEHTERARYIERCEAAGNVVGGLRANLARLREVRADLLPALLSGEHEIPEPYDQLMEEAS